MQIPPLESISSNKFYRKTIKKLELENQDGSKKNETPFSEHLKSNFINQNKNHQKDIFEKNFEGNNIYSEKKRMQEELIKKAKFITIIENDQPFTQDIETDLQRQCMSFTPYLTAMK